jgi:hypothetical protein
MRDAVRRVIERFPLQFRLLYRQFLLRVIDLESLSIEADIPRFLGQFAGVLIMISVFQTFGFVIVSGGGSDLRSLLRMGLHTVQSLLAGTMLIAGLTAVATWDNIFPDLRDAMVLGPLPVRRRTILAAKLASAASLLAIGILSLNCGMGTVLPLLAGGLLRFPLILAAYWFTVSAAAFFVFGAVLTIEGLLAAMLPRRWFLRLSSLLQLASFALFLSVWLFQPSYSSAAEFASAQQQGILARWPMFWFFGMFCQTSGIFPIALTRLALRAWLGLVAVGAGAVASLLLCYLRTMKKTVEEPDLVQRRSHARWTVPLGDSLQTAVVRFSLRSLVRSRQHRVVYAFFLAIAFAIAVSTLTQVANTHRTQPVTPEFLMNTLMMMCLAVAGLRGILSLPVSLKANWVLQVTQLSPPERYIAATRRAMLLMATIPVWASAAGLSLCYRPWHQVAEHLLVLALAGSIMTDITLVGVSKISFACSYLPGKSNVQFMFWAFVIVFIPLAMMFSHYEQSVFDHPRSYTLLVAILLIAALILWLFNRHQAKSAVLYYEESEPEVITTIGIGSWQPINQEASAQNH